LTVIKSGRIPKTNWPETEKKKKKKVKRNMK